MWKREDFELALLLGSAGVSLAMFTVTEGWRVHLESAGKEARGLGDRFRVLKARGSLDALLRVTGRRCGIMFACGAAAGMVLRPIVVLVKGTRVAKKD
jgi:hypothetical protein